MCRFSSILFVDPGYNSTEVCSEATEMEYLRKVLFEYMMGRETKVCPSQEPAHVWPVVTQLFITVTDAEKMPKCVSRCFSLTASVGVLCVFTRILYSVF